MSTEYGLVTRDMAEKEILKVLNDKLKYFLRKQPIKIMIYIQAILFKK